MFLVVDLRLEFMEGHVHGGMKLLGRASALMFPHYGNNGLVNIHENWLTGGRLTPIIPVAILWSASRGSRSRPLTGKWASSKASLKKSFMTASPGRKYSKTAGSGRANGNDARVPATRRRAWAVPSSGILCVARLWLRPTPSNLGHQELETRSATEPCWNGVRPSGTVAGPARALGSRKTQDRPLPRPTQSFARCVPGRPSRHRHGSSGIRPGAAHRKTPVPCRLGRP